MSVTSQRAMLEAAIAADFDDPAAHAAYADLLIEEGDPRGEWIQLHLALENKDQSPRLLAEWRQRAHRLRQTHERDWLGRLAPFLLSPPRPTVEPDTPNIEYSWRRGWLVELDVHDVRDAFTRVLADAPEARMLQALTLRNTRLPNNHGPLEPLTNSPYLRALRSFALGDPETFGFTAEGGLVPALVRSWAGLRELEVRAAGVRSRELFSVRLPELRSLAVDFLSAVPLAVLAGNPSLAHLERLSLVQRPALAANPTVAEEGVEFQVSFDDPVASFANELRAFLAAPQFARLTDLALRVPDLGDAGGAALARSPDLRHLDRLDVGGNRITPLGVSRLQEAGIRVQWDSQWGDYPEPDAGGDYIT